MIAGLLVFVGCTIGLLIALALIWGFVLLPIQLSCDNGIGYCASLKRIWLTK